MVHFLQCSSNAHMLLRLFFFSIILLIASMEVAHSDARRLPLKLLEIGTSSKEQQEDESRVEMMKMEGRGLIGSRPPRCERVCMSCGHCEAVQVPIVPQDHHHKRATRSSAGQEHHPLVAISSSAAMLTTYSVDGGLSNYKPLSWKCKCGGIILDP